MAAKRKIAPPKPDPNRSWSELTKAEQSAHYAQALHAYTNGTGPNPKTLGQFSAQKAHSK